MSRIVQGKVKGNEGFPREGLGGEGMGNERKEVTGR
jgi:hypothetical protein